MSVKLRLSNCRKLLKYTDYIKILIITFKHNNIKYIYYLVEIKYFSKKQNVLERRNTLEGQFKNLYSIRYTLHVCWEMIKKF